VSDGGPLDRRNQSPAARAEEFKRLYNSHIPQLTAILRREYPEVDHESVTQHAVMKLYENWASVTGSAEAWLTTTARNRATDIKRREKKFTEVALEEEHVIGVPPSTPEMVHANSETLAVLTSLPRAESVAILMYVAGHDYTEIAEELEVTRETAATYVSRARAKVRIELPTTAKRGRGRHKKTTQPAQRSDSHKEAF
jgi:RNA polymerase sigma factor (sigma-70 family)